MRFCARLLAFVSALAALTCPAAEKPNILFLFTDDQSYEAIHCAGRLKIETPNLDRLAGRGMMFTHAYNMGAWHGAVCVASRTMLNTGRSLWSAHGIEKTLAAERDAGRMWAPMMHKAGYETYFTGKWHVAIKPGSVFDHCSRELPGMPPTVPSAYNRPLEGKPDSWRSDDPANGGYWKGGTHWSVVTADHAIEHLDSAAKSDKPFFLYTAFNAPHDPRQAPTEFLDRYDVAKIDVPKSFLPEYPHAKSMGAGPTLRDEKLAPFPRTEFAVRTHRREYFALVTHLDAQIGRILEALETNGQTDNTWIFLTSDHGLSCGHHGLMGKQNPYDVAVRVPFLVSGPGVPAGEICREPIYLQDVMPTTLELAGADLPEHVEFRSLLPFLRGESGATGRESVYYAYMDTQRAITHDGWKLIVYPKARVVRLYQVSKDPDETKDLAWNKLYAGRIRSLFGKLVELQDKHGDPLDLKSLYPHL
ncbi:MAG: sulfatase-like hydrolase/transferase [Verrucomicrobiae bacterium]|nr:sulfatase-like hydrolase/transferase [Verrucomicrobiae bacterium]